MNKQTRALRRRHERQEMALRAVVESRLDKATRLYDSILTIVKAESDAEAGINALITVLAAYAGSVATRTGYSIVDDLKARLDKAAPVAELEARRALGIVEELAPAPVLSREVWHKRLVRWIMRGLR